MAKADSTGGTSTPSLNIEFMRSLVKQYSELGQWNSALFWADAAAGAGAASNPTGAVNGDDIWLLASALLARGELHRAAYAVTSRGLHKRHLLCLGVAMRAYVAAREPMLALTLLEESDPMITEQRHNDQTHNRALAGVLVCQARALSALERRDAACEALSSALRADGACVEALDLLLDQRALTTAQEAELIESLSLSSQLAPAEGALVKAAYRERLSPTTKPRDPHDLLSSAIESARSKTSEAAISRAKCLTANCQWTEALKSLDSVDPWCAAEVRVSCLVELKKSAELFAFAHTLVDAYPQSWQAWYAVGCYYYLIRKSEFARRYLSKAKSMHGAGCVWLVYGHCFAMEGEHDQAIAAYFKASQLMPGCHLPPLYVGVEHALLNNFPTCERFLMRAAQIHNATCESSGDSTDEADENKTGWEAIARVVTEPHIAHEAGAAALASGQVTHAATLWMRAFNHPNEVNARWAPTLDALGHACRKMGKPAEALQWHERALALRPGRAETYAAMGLCLALLGKETEAADALHTALSKNPDDVVAQALLDAIIDRVDDATTDEEIPQFPFPPVNIALPAPATPNTPATPGTGAGMDLTNMSDMSMSFD